MDVSNYFLVLKALDLTVIKLQKLKSCKLNITETINIRDIENYLYFKQCSAFSFYHIMKVWVKIVYLGSYEVQRDSIQHLEEDLAHYRYIYIYIFNSWSKLKSKERNHKTVKDFPGSSVVKTLNFCCKRHRFDPWRGA